MNVQRRKKNPDHVSAVLGGGGLHDPAIRGRKHGARLIGRGPVRVPEKTGYGRGQQKERSRPYPSREEERYEADGRQTRNIAPALFGDKRPAGMFSRLMS